MKSKKQYEVQLDPEKALHATITGGTLLLLDVPQGTWIGIDHQAFRVGATFSGIKMLPPGPHFFSSLVSDGGITFSPVVGYFIHLDAHQVEAWRFDKNHEALCKITDDEEAERYRVGVKRFDFDRGLAPYDLASFRQWKALSGFLNRELIKQLSPVHGGISVMAEGKAMALDKPTTHAEQKLVEQLHMVSSKQDACKQECSNISSAEMACDAKSYPDDEQRFVNNEQTVGAADAIDVVGRCFYSHIPGLIKRKGITPEELTILNLDKSQILVDIINKTMEGQEDRILGEFQFAFIAFVMCQSLDGFQQWKSIIRLMLSCQDAPLSSHADLFSKFLDVLHAQLSFGIVDWKNGPIEEGVFGIHGLMEDLIDDNFLKQSLLCFIQGIQEAAHSADGNVVDLHLLNAVQKIADFIKAKLGWDASEPNNGEFDPVVVDL